MTFGKDATIIWNTFMTSNVNPFYRNMTENVRKRQREDDTCEFMPLSKRINNLHINNNLGSVAHGPVQDFNQISAVDNAVSSPGSSTGSDRRPSYDPGINNSSYYFDNKLLFELHLERVQRTGQQYPY